MTAPLDLEEVERACAEATPGPWGYTYDGSSGWSIGQADDPQGACVASVHDRTDERARRDVPFIANARSWVPELAKRVRELEAVLTKAAKGATERPSSWEFRGEAWREGYMDNGRMLADYISSALEAIRSRGKP